MLAPSYTHNRLSTFQLKNYIGKIGRVKGLFIFCFCLILSGCQQNNASTSSSILVFSAASLRDVMQEIAAVYEEQTGISVTFNFAGSNVLALQIEASLKADVFLSANTQWVDYLDNKNILEDDSRRQILSNSMAFISHLDADYEISSPENILDLPFRYLSIGDPNAVPAGRYAKDYLNSISLNQNRLWSYLSNKILPAPDARAAIAAVERMPDIIGLVYKTDALASSKIRILYEPSMEDIPKIEYVGASIRKNNSLAKNQQPSAENMSESKGKEFLNFLAQVNVASIFEKHGFIQINEVPEFAALESLH